MADAEQHCARPDCRGSGGITGVGTVEVELCTVATTTKPARMTDAGLWTAQPLVRTWGLRSPGIARNCPPPPPAPPAPNTPFPPFHPPSSLALLAQDLPLCIFIARETCPCALVNANSGLFFGEGGLWRFSNIVTSHLQHADSVYNWQTASTWGKQCPQTTDRQDRVPSPPPPPHTPW